MTEVARGRRFVGLDGFRGYLALSILVGHTLGVFAPIVMQRTHTDLLGQAVVVFFALSGFLIYLPFMNRIIDGGTLPSIGRYAQARALRIYPAWIAIFLVSDFALRAVYVENAMMSAVPGGGGNTGVIVDPWRILLHLTLLQNYIPAELQTGINTSWTLTIELTFYLILPLLTLLALRLGRHWTGRRRYLLAAIPGIALIALGAASRIVAWLIGARSGVSFLDAEWGPNGLAVFNRSFAVSADNFGWGMVATVALAAVQRGVIGRSGRVRPRSVAVIALAVALVAAATSIAVQPVPLPFIVAAGSAMFILVLLLPTRDGETSRLARAIDWPPVHYLGTISLGIYLWHYPVLLVVLRSGWSAPDTFAGAAWDVAMVAGISIALASLSYWLIERPALRLSARLSARISARIDPQIDARIDARRPG